MSEVLLHPNVGDSVVEVDGVPYHWDGPICAYRRGYGPYAAATAIGRWRPADAATAQRLSREVAKRSG